VVRQALCPVVTVPPASWRQDEQAPAVA
jgi:hypothetical protein